MKKLLIAALLAGVGMPANAGMFITAALQADIAWSGTDDLRQPFDKYVGLYGQSFDGDPSGPLNYTSGTPFDVACSKCLNYTITGNTVEFSLLPQFHPTYGAYDLTLTFDQDLQGDIAKIASAGFVSGRLATIGGGTGFGSLFSGPVVKFSAYLPEPSTWALMIAGFALTGASLRRRQESSRLMQH
jgi:hypothetical protein